MVVITIFRWGYKPTYNQGAPHCAHLRRLFPEGFAQVTVVFADLKAQVEQSDDTGVLKMACIIMYN